MRVVKYAKPSLSKVLEAKSKVDAEVGISEYWVVNLKKLQLVVFRHPQGGEYTSESILASGTIQPLAFPGVNISVNSILNQ